MRGVLQGGPWTEDRGARPGGAPFNGYGQEWTRYWTGWESLDRALAPDSAGYNSEAIGDKVTLGR